MKVICIKNEDGTGGVPWSNGDFYHKLKVGEIYEGNFLEKNGTSWIHLKEFNYDFCTPFWFMSLTEWRENQLNKIGI
jgi:hypothetical protein